MIQIIMLGVIIVLLIVLIIARFISPSHIRQLEHSVILKKLQLSEKILDSQMNGQPDLSSLMQQGEMMKAAQKQSEEDKPTPVGYAQSAKN